MYSLLYLTSPPSPSGGIWAQQTKQSPDLNITESKPALKQSTQKSLEDMDTE